MHAIRFSVVSAALSLALSVPAWSAAASAPSPVEGRQTSDQTADSAAPMRCYRAARGEDADPYICDLAVQMARDSGSSRALAAALADRALVLERAGHLDPALDDLNAALQQTPDDPALYGDRGNLLLRLGRPADAVGAFDRAVELAPDDPRGYYNRAFGYRALGDPTRAAQDVAVARSLLEGRADGVTPPGTPAPAADSPR